MMVKVRLMMMVKVRLMMMMMMDASSPSSSISSRQ